MIITKRTHKMPINVCLEIKQPEKKYETPPQIEVFKKNIGDGFIVKLDICETHIEIQDEASFLNRNEHCILMEFIKEFRMAFMEFWHGLINEDELTKILSNKNALIPYKFTKEEVLKIKKLNKKLKKIEKDIIIQQRSLLKSINKRIKDKKDWLTDYEIILEIDFMLNDKHPMYRDDSNNFLAIYETCISRKFIKKGSDLLGSKLNWNEYRDNAGHPLNKIKFCYLMHELLIHRNVDEKYICQIGDIWVDIQAIYQRCYKNGPDKKQCRNNSSIKNYL